MLGMIVRNREDVKKMVRNAMAKFAISFSPQMKGGQRTTHGIKSARIL